MTCAIKSLKPTWFWPSRPIDPERLTQDEVEIHSKRADSLMNYLIDTAVLLGESQLAGEDRSHAAFLLRFSAGHLALINSNLKSALKGARYRTLGTRHMVRWLNRCIGDVDSVRAKLGCSTIKI
jgi:hypothetical protein